MTTHHESKTPEQSSQTNPQTPEQTPHQTPKNPGKDDVHEQRKDPQPQEGAL